jgi:transcription initiation factor TFIIIB Brf1 subunit/transcription initiation factor TFIIB
MTDLWPSLAPKRPTATSEEPFPALDEIDGPTTSHTCSTCEDDTHIEDVGTEVVCTKCGSIIDIPLEWTAEYRWYSADAAAGGGADPSRCSFPINHLMPESSLGTMIHIRGGSAVMRRLKRYHMWNQMPYRERTLWTVFDSLQVRATNAGVGTAVIEEAKELYAQLTATAICRGQAQRDAMLAACLWESLKRHETPRMPKDIADVFNIPMKHVTRGIKQFQQLLAIRTTSEATDTYAAAGGESKKSAAVASSTPVVESTAELVARAHHRRAIWQKTAARTTSYEDFIVPFLTNLSIPRLAASDLEALVRQVCARVDDLGIVPENTPPSLTASVIAFCCAELKITMDNTDIARVCGISAVTIQKCLKRMGPWRAKIMEVEDV